LISRRGRDEPGLLNSRSPCADQNLPIAETPNVAVLAWRALDQDPLKVREKAHGEWAFGDPIEARFGGHDVVEDLAHLDRRSGAVLDRMKTMACTGPGAMV
jgi:hypothetical protein